MAPLDYWHPVLDGRQLPADRPVGVTVAGHSLALFRAGGRAAAVDDQCAHRRMKLSVGTVCGDRLVCPYHGWSYDRDGHAESPSAPRIQACVPSYDCAESGFTLGRSTCPGACESVIGVGCSGLRGQASAST